MKINTDGKKTYATAGGQLLFGLLGIACFLKPDLVSIASSCGLTILTPDQALLSLFLGLSQIFSGAKSIFSRMAITKINKDK